MDNCRRVENSGFAKLSVKETTRYLSVKCPGERQSNLCILELPYQASTARTIITITLVASVLGI